MDKIYGWGVKDSSHRGGGISNELYATKDEVVAVLTKSAISDPFAMYFIFTITDVVSVSIPTVVTPVVQAVQE